MISFLSLVRKELLVLSRDRHGLLVLFVMPAIFILIMSLALRDAFNERRAVAETYALVDQDGSAASAEFAKALAGKDLFHPISMDVKGVGNLRDHLYQVVSREDYKYAVLIPKGFGERIETRASPSGKGTKAEGDPLLRVFLAPSVLPQARRSFLLTLRGELQRLESERLLKRLSPMVGMDSEDLLKLSDPDTLKIDEVFAYHDRVEEERIPSAVQQNVPAWLVFAMFFVVFPVSTGFITEREQGSLLRLRIMNVSAFKLLAAKVFPYYLVNLIQTVLMLAVGVFLVPRLGGEQLQLGHSPFGLFLIGSATGIAAIGYALLVSAVARTVVQATMVGGVSALVFGAVGGVMVPKFVMPPFMQNLSVLSPMSWGLEGFWDILLRQGGWMDALPEVAVLCGFGAVCLLLGAAVFRRN